jgi:hypothetical protein
MKKISVVCPTCHITDMFEMDVIEGSFYENCLSCHKSFWFHIEDGVVIKTELSRQQKMNEWDKKWTFYTIEVICLIPLLVLIYSYSGFWTTLIVFILLIYCLSFLPNNRWLYRK